jgi:hypothetical protein
MSSEDATTTATMGDLVAIAKRAEDAAKAATTAAAAATAGRDGADTEAKARGLNLPAEVLDQIAQASSALTVAALREEFDVSGPPTESGSSTAGVAGTSDAGTQDGGTPAPATSDPPPAAPRNWAQKFLGVE